MFSSTPGVFGFENGFSPEVRQLSPNYFLSPEEKSLSKASTLSGVFSLILVVSYLCVAYL